jgi:glycosyltransferase involved in cell wall biosynthesis
MNSRTNITVIVCTYNRSRTLAKTIESVASQILPQSLSWELLVIDNNSSDDTRQVVEDFQRRYPERIRYSFEPQQGLSHARNTGIRETRSEILAFLDDDEIAVPAWLQSLTASLHSGEWAGAGGRVLPEATFSPPRWLLASKCFTTGPLSSFDQGLDACELNEPPFGANMAFRKAVFDELGAFRTDLGRSGTNMISNEDTEFGRRVMGAGLRLRYEPSAVTYHPVDQSRLQKRYFLTWWYNKGRSDMREFGIEPHSKLFLGMPVRLLRSFVWQTARWLVSLKPAERFNRKLQIWASTGQILESRFRWLNARQIGREGRTPSSLSAASIRKNS